MSAYSLVPLVDICRPKQWPTISSSQLTKDGYSVYGANGKIGFYSEFTHAEPTLMITCRGATCGNVHISEPNSYINGNAMALDNMSDNVDLRYLYYFFKSRGFNDVISGSAQPQITRQGLTKIEIPLPPLAEQKRIAAILDKADALRRKRQQAIDLADQFLRSVFLDMFGDPVTNPKGWETRKLGELILNGPTNGLYKPSKDYGNGTRILRIDGFYNGALEPQINLKRVQLSAKEIEKYALSDGSIVINRVNSREYLGKCALIEGLEEPTVFESNMMNFSVDPRVVKPGFIVDQLCTPYVKGQILTCCKDAVNQSSINQQDVKSLELRLPPLELQKKYLRIVCKTRASIKSMKNIHEESLDLSASLSLKAFSGEL